MKAFEVVIHCSGLVLDIQQEKEVLYFWLSCGHWPKRQAIPFIPRTVEFAEMVQIEVFWQNVCAKIYRALRWVSQKTETISTQIMNTWKGHLKQQKANIYRLSGAGHFHLAVVQENFYHTLTANVEKKYSSTFGNYSQRWYFCQLGGGGGKRVPQATQALGREGRPASPTWHQD